MSVDKFLNRKYDANKYNCAHLVAEAWKEETGVDISSTLAGFLLPPKSRQARLSECRRFAPVTVPVSPCIVLMQQRRRAPHVGIFLRGKVLHIERNGVKYQPLEIARLGFLRVRFYTC